MKKVENEFKSLKDNDCCSQKLQYITNEAIKMFQDGSVLEAAKRFLYIYEENYLQDIVLKVLMENYYDFCKVAILQTYENNLQYLHSYPYFLDKNLLLPFDEIKIQAIKICDDVYVNFNQEINCFSDLYELEKQQDEMPFFSDLSNPLLMKNEKNLYNIKYICDNIRLSEDYGADNHLYLYYETMDSFLTYLQLVDIRPYLTDEKIVFLIGENQLAQHYPLDFKHLFGIDYSLSASRPLKITEIKRIFVEWLEQTMSGNYFFAGVLDYHKNFLTVKEFGLAGFDYLYKKILQDRTVDEVCDELRNLQDGLIYSEIRFLFFQNGLTNDTIKVPDINEFFNHLREIFPNNRKPNRLEWFKGLYLAYSMALERELNQRIAPAIVFHIHGMGYPTQIEDMYDVFRQFEYFKAITIIRRPTIVLGARVNLFEKEEPGKINYIKCINDFVLEDKSLMSRSEYRLYIPADDIFLPNRRVMRFEDLKLHPMAMLTSLCDFLDIEWDDTLLKVTANGSEHTMKLEKGRSVGGYDTKPVYNLHEECFSKFDYYRIELVTMQYYQYWGYKAFYHNDSVEYSNEDILKMFEIKFKCEDFHRSAQQQNSDLAERKRMYRLVKKLLEQPVPQYRDNVVLQPIQWLKPKLELQEGKLYE